MTNNVEKYTNLHCTFVNPTKAEDSLGSLHHYFDEYKLKPLDGATAKDAFGAIALRDWACERKNSNAVAPPPFAPRDQRRYILL